MLLLYTYRPAMPTKESYLLLHLLGMNSAHALTCAPTDAACNDANTLRDRINAIRPGAISDGHPKTRRRTGKIRDRLASIYAIADAGSCTMDGLIAFRYDLPTWRGDWNRLSNSGDLSGFFLADGEINGTYRGDANGNIGNFGLWSDTGKRFVAEWDAQDAVVGGYVQMYGRTGVGYAATGTCPGEIEIAFLPYMPELLGIDDDAPPASGAGFLRVTALDAAAGGAAASPSFRINFALGGSNTPAESTSLSLNPTIQEP